MAHFGELKKSYKIAAKNKHRNQDYVGYDLHRCRNLLRLQKQLKDHTLQPRIAAYIVEKPVIREVFSADMDMCTIHHYLDEQIRGEFEKRMTNRVFNNRKNMGLDKALNQVATDIYEVSEGFAKDCWVAVLDVKGYFPNASQEISYNNLESLINVLDVGEDKREELIYMLRRSIYCYPSLHCEYRTPKYKWRLLEKGKSLLDKPLGIGAPAGMLIEQTAMTFYSNVVMQWAVNDCKMHITEYGDDFVCVVDNKEVFLAEFVPEFRRRMADIHCLVHPRKFYFQHYTKGVKFCSQRIKMDRIYCGNRIIRNFREKVIKWNRRVSERNIGHLLDSLNSYTGILKRRNEYGNLKKIVAMINPKWWQYIEFDTTNNMLVAREGWTHSERLIKRFNIKSFKKHGRICKRTSC